MQKLAFLGDSLTQWFGWDRRFPDYEVLNLGISGERVEELRKRIPEIYDEVRNPDFLFLMTGINNIGEGDCRFFDDYREIVRNLTTHYKSAKTVAQSILPTTLEWLDNDRIRDCNRRIREIAGEFGAEYLDVYQTFVDAQGAPNEQYLQEDGVHVSSSGYEAWSIEVEHFLKTGASR